MDRDNLTVFFKRIQGNTLYCVVLNTGTPMGFQRRIWGIRKKSGLYWRFSLNTRWYLLFCSSASTQVSQIINEATQLSTFSIQGEKSRYTQGLWADSPPRVQLNYSAEEPNCTRWQPLMTSRISDISCCLTNEAALESYPCGLHRGIPLPRCFIVPEAKHQCMKLTIYIISSTH